jgi:hypothetical protein
MSQRHHRHAARNRIVDWEVLKLELRQARLRTAPRIVETRPAPGK